MVKRDADTESAPGKLAVRQARRRHRAHQLEPVQIGAEALEQPLAGAAQNRHQVDLHLVDEPSGPILPRGVGTSQRNVPADGALRRTERRFDDS